MTSASPERRQLPKTKQHRRLRQTRQRLERPLVISRTSTMSPTLKLRLVPRMPKSKEVTWASRLPGTRVQVPMLRPLTWSGGNSPLLPITSSENLRSNWSPLSATSALASTYLNSRADSAKTDRQPSSTTTTNSSPMLSMVMQASSPPNRRLPSARTDSSSLLMQKASSAPTSSWKTTSTGSSTQRIAPLTPRTVHRPWPWWEQTLAFRRSRLVVPSMVTLSTLTPAVAWTRRPISALQTTPMPRTTTVVKEQMEKTLPSPWPQLLPLPLPPPHSSETFCF